jgi:hypothetical protein
VRNFETDVSGLPIGTTFTVKILPMASPQALTSNHFKPRNPEDARIQFNRRGSLGSRKVLLSSQFLIVDIVSTALLITKCHEFRDGKVFNGNDFQENLLTIVPIS